MKVTIPFNAGAQMLAALLGNQVQALLISLPSLQGQVETGKVKLLGVASLGRYSRLPELPTIAETLPGFAAGSVWTGISGPAGLPREVVTKWNVETNAVLKNEDVIRQLEKLGLIILGGSPEAFDEVVRADIERLTQGAKISGIKPE